MTSSDYAKPHDSMECPYIAPIDDDENFYLPWWDSFEESYDQMVERAFEAAEHAGTGSQSMQDPMDPDYFADVLMGNINMGVAKHNKECADGNQWSTPTALTPKLVAMCIAYVYRAVQVEGEDGKRTLAVVSLYDHMTDYAGTLYADERRVRDCAREFNSMLTSEEVDEVIACLREIAPVRKLTTAPNLLPVMNGVYDFETNELHPYRSSTCSNRDYFFLHKYPVRIPTRIIGGPVVTAPNGKQLTFGDWFFAFLRLLLEETHFDGEVRYEDLFPNAVENADSKGPEALPLNPFLSPNSK